MVCVGITRDNHFFVPSGDDHLSLGDEVYCVVDATHVERAMRAFGHEDKMAERIIIAGGGNIGLFLAQEIEQRWPSASLTLIEANAERARFIADQLPQHVVLKRRCARCRDPQRGQSRKPRMPSSVSTNDDEVNIMAALLAKRSGDLKALTLINNTAYSALLGPLDIDVMINPRETTVSSVLLHVRRGRIRSAYSIRDGEAEVFEAEVLETSSLVGQMIKEARLPAGVIVGAILRDDAVVVPRGDTTIQTGDRVVLIARGPMVKKAERLFSVRIDYF